MVQLAERSLLTNTLVRSSNPDVGKYFNYVHFVGKTKLTKKRPITANFKSCALVWVSRSCRKIQYIFDIATYTWNSYC